MAPALQRPRIYSEIEDLEKLGRSELVTRWIGLYGSPPFKVARQVSLIRGIAYKLQCKHSGELDRALELRLLKPTSAGSISDPASRPKKTRAAPSPKIKLGSRLIREWNGRTYVVNVTAEGFEMAGTRYRSLSAAAKAITGTQWSGPRFFGVSR
ncbi:MAG: DUF2924 domain-containing protein [Alphaproteobacteria bacterium]